MLHPEKLSIPPTFALSCTHPTQSFQFVRRGLVSADPYVVHNQERGAPKLEKYSVGHEKQMFICRFDLNVKLKVNGICQ
jgi:hypothetical protein